MTLGSLFDGIGGFPLVASLSGITPVWAAEVEPFCIAVTKQRFPDMLHLGDITKIDGSKIPPVDIITFGSPCQDLSVAGKREGLSGSRSGLFHEAMRIIYEMREATNGTAPTYIVWENVAGAFSSNKGNDFRTVLEEITKTDIPIPESGKWANAGMVRGSRITAAWRVLDAQYWRVPQQRKRIYLIGSFGSDAAGEILFEPEGMPGYTPQSRTKGKETAGTFESCVGITGGKAIFENHGQDSRYMGPLDVIPTITARYGTGGNNQPLVVDTTQSCFVYRLTPLECERLQGYPDGWTTLCPITDLTAEEESFWRNVYITDVTVRGKEPRRMTKEQLIRWHNKLESDSRRYKAIGNSLAIPCAFRVIGGIAKYEEAKV